MKAALFSTKDYHRESLGALESDHELIFHEARLSAATVPLAFGQPAVCALVNDVPDREVLSLLAEHGLKLVTLRCAGFNNVDPEAAAEFGITVDRVPAYFPDAVAEHTCALILSGTVIRDDVFSRLLRFLDVFITGHQGFFMADALERLLPRLFRICPNLRRPECVQMLLNRNWSRPGESHWTGADFLLTVSRTYGDVGFTAGLVQKYG